MSLLLACVAAAGAAWLADGQSTPSYEDQVIGVAVRQSFGDAAPQVAAEPLEIQALLLDYADNEPLLLKARVALMRYPDLARRILPVYGDKPDFQEVLLNYGEAAFPPIAYFMDHDLTSLNMRHTLGEWTDEIKHHYGRLMVARDDPESAAPVTHPTVPMPDNVPSETAIDDAQPGTPPAHKLSAEERGWYAIQFLQGQGYNFLGQFVVARNGKADWVQTERVMESLPGFFLGGLRSLETKWRHGDNIEGADLGWAALDVIVIGSTMKLFRALRAARVSTPAANAARAGGFSQRVTVFGSRVLAGSGRLGVAVVRLGAIPAAIYLMVAHPELINATLAVLGGWLGINIWLVQFAFWLVTILLVSRLALFLLAPLSWVLRSLGWVVGVLADWFRPHMGHIANNTVCDLNAENSVPQ
jgi:hypothetical protein